MWGYGLDRADSGQGQVASSGRRCDESCGAIKCGEFLGWLKNCHFFLRRSLFHGVDELM